MVSYESNFPHPILVKEGSCGFVGFDAGRLDMMKLLARSVVAIFFLLMLTQTGCSASKATTVSDRVFCPEWAQETVPDWVKPHLARGGLPKSFSKDNKLGGETVGIDMWQANHFVAYNKDTARYLYSTYSPTSVTYRKGTLPTCEKIVAEYTVGCKTDREKALALLSTAMSKVTVHPSIPPYGPMVRPDRGADEETLLKYGCLWCNEQARVFVRLCQVAGIPARLVFLFLSEGKDGHVVAEFYADRHWCMADASYGCAFLDESGRLMSAAEVHKDQASKLQAGKAYIERFKVMETWPAEQLVGGRYVGISDPAERAKRIAADIEGARDGLRKRTAEEMGYPFWAFGVMNYPPPP